MGDMYVGVLEEGGQCGPGMSPCLPLHVPSVVRYRVGGVATRD